MVEGCDGLCACHENYHTQGKNTPVGELMEYGVVCCMRKLCEVNAWCDEYEHGGKMCSLRVHHFYCFYYASVLSYYFHRRVIKIYIFLRGTFLQLFQKLCSKTC